MPNEYIEKRVALQKVAFAGKLSDAYDEVKSIPAADVEPVVRCGDCVHYGRLRKRICDRHEIMVYPSGFCDHGERRKPE